MIIFFLINFLLKEMIILKSGNRLWQVILKKMRHSFWPLLSHDVLEVLQQSAWILSIGFHINQAGRHWALSSLCSKATGGTEDRPFTLSSGHLLGRLLKTA